MKTLKYLCLFTVVFVGVGILACGMTDTGNKIVRKYEVVELKGWAPSANGAQHYTRKALLKSEKEKTFVFHVYRTDLHNPSVRHYFWQELTLKYEENVGGEVQYFPLFQIEGTRTVLAKSADLSLDAYVSEIRFAFGKASKDQFEAMNQHYIFDEAGKAK